MSGGVPLAGVIGDPIAHSKSPKLHGHWLRHFGIAGHYVPLHVASGDLPAVLAAMPRMGFVGANVTIPHKESVMSLCDSLSDTARRIGAVNTLSWNADGKLHGDNTDAYGFIENLTQTAAGWQARGQTALVLGAGGASRAVIVALLDAGVAQIVLTNRSMGRAEALAAEFGTRIRVAAWGDTENHVAQAGLLVNTTSLGMAGQEALPFSLANISPRCLVTDIVYNPLETPLLAAARAMGCPVVDGLGMLLHQAVPGFERWFGTRPIVDAKTRAAVLG
ncbi:MAG: shikimate dehydrogenase [Cypionkella sp.]|nr:shikimate dehydrogenase [Cypionkella sp.]